MSQPINILWTGGWDSTFRVLYASIVEGRQVFPHYIIDFERRSSLRELQAISDIRKSLISLNEDAAKRIAELKITPITEIAKVADITKSYQRLRSRAHLGTQYDWLARYAKTNNIENLELSIHVDDKAYYFLNGKVDQPADGQWKLKDSITGDEYIFSYFTFPLLETSKTDMREIAEKFGFIDLLERSWFCFNPTHGKPCGICNPCIYTAQEGMGYRLPKSAKLRYRTRHFRLAARAPFTVLKKIYKKIK
ncbi:MULTISPECIES: hypothetical protein [unclassified Ectothiorhodospira]|uniref:hypothetical protein n=1 Tax=unclassified Ectothiorhodospira TaxID=2684909 RepID=UPI001EE853B3|nr:MULTISPECIES: hypothetical protein [unclassified Ectothiorhodospira]MCG5516871.1 hypothetical protein [Ectothiorhodospira sp. 9100]MCG5519744.1 hypothetical protein [Ectothiorhodospira sp. 9905]